MIYDYLLVVFRLIAGIMSNKTIVLCAVLGIIIYVVWAGLCAFLGFGYKFYKKTDKLTEFVKANDGSEETLQSIAEQAKEISVGLERGIKTYAKNRTNTPSAYISKGEALDSEVRGGIFNHGKSFMRAFINFSTVLLLVLNLEYLGADKTFTASVFAQATILPIVYYFIIKLFYFLYNLIQQQFYKLDVESFGKLLDALDEKFGKTVSISVTASGEDAENSGNDELLPEEEAQSEEQEATNDATEEQAPEEEVPQEPQQKTLDDYDFFKRKNIDVEKLKGEVPANSSVMPYIDVDSDYVIKDDETSANSYHPNATNGSEVLGGMLHNMSGVKKAESQQEPAAEPVQQPEHSDEPVAPKIETKPAEKKSDDFDNVFSGLESYEINSDDNDNSRDNSEVERKIEEEAKPLESATTEDVPPSLSEKQNENPVDVSDVIEKIDELSNKANEETETHVEEENLDSSSANSLSASDIFEEETEPATAEQTPAVEDVVEDRNIASIVGRFKPKSKLASGGVEIERNTRTFNETRPKPEKEVHVLSADSDADSVLNSFKNSTTAGQIVQENYNNPYETQNNVSDQNYYTTNYQGQTGYNAPQNTFVGVGYNAYNQPNYMGGYQGGYQNYPNQNQTEFYGGFNGSTVNEGDYEEEEEEYVEAPAKPKREYKPRTTSSKKKEEKPLPKEEDVEETKRRGRPAKQVFDETVSIKDDKEFEQVLSRAEKLMRKSEQGLSQSQAKRVEKELQSLLEAMNRYKEGK